MKRLRTALRAAANDRPNSLLLGWIPRLCFDCRRPYVPLRQGEGVIRVDAPWPAVDGSVHGHPRCCVKAVRS